MVLFATDYSKITLQNPFFFMFILTIGSFQLHLAFVFDRYVAFTSHDSKQKILRALEMCYLLVKFQWLKL